MEKKPLIINVSGSADFVKDEDRRYAVVDGRIDSAVREATGSFIDLKTATDKAAKAVAEFGEGAKVVPPYSPNRKQRRAQKSRQRRK